MESKANERGSSVYSECDSDGSGGTECSHEEGGDRITLIGSQCPPFRDEPKSNSQKGIYLDTKLAGEITSREQTDENCRRQVIPVMVVFDLPDGSQIDQQFQMGQTVEVLKGFLESEVGIPMSRQELYLGSTLMMDPMSLLDYPQVECGTGEVLIAVEGDMDTILKDGEAKT